MTSPSDVQRLHRVTDSLERRRKKLQRFVSMYPPFLGAGVRVKEISSDLRTIEVRMPLTFWNKNYVGTHFGGSLYTHVRSVFMLILLNHPGPDYLVWDKAATIRFKKPGTGTVKAVFHVPRSASRRFAHRPTPRGKVSQLSRPW
jgi:hypothetical protein